MFTIEAIASTLLVISLVAYLEFGLLSKKPAPKPSTTSATVSTLFTLLVGVAIFFGALIVTNAIHGLTPKGFTLAGWCLTTLGGSAFVVSQYWSLRRLFYASVGRNSSQMPKKEPRQTTSDREEPSTQQKKTECCNQSKNV